MNYELSGSNTCGDAWFDVQDLMCLISRTHRPCAGTWSVYIRVGPKKHTQEEVKYVDEEICINKQQSQRKLPSPPPPRYRQSVTLPFDGALATQAQTFVKQ